MSGVAKAAQGPSDSRLPPHTYTPKHRWAIKLNFLSGITLLPWLTLLARHWRSIDWLVYPHRVLFLTFMAVLNTVLALFDWLFFSRAVAAQPLHPEPVFILGHPRTGTTHLHNLLSTDPRFAFATTFHAGFPSSFLSLEPLRWALSGLLEPRRPMDHMALDWDLPAEDEIAVNVLTGGDSPYMALVLPRLWRPLLRSYLTFSTGEAATVGPTAPAAPAGVDGSTAALQDCSLSRGAAGWSSGASGADTLARSTVTSCNGNSSSSSGDDPGAGRVGAATGRTGPDGRQAAGSEGECESGAVGSGNESKCGGMMEGSEVAAGGAAAPEGRSGPAGGDPRVSDPGPSDPRLLAAFRRWLAAFTWFMKKVTYRHVRNNRISRHRRGTSAPAGGSCDPPPPLLIKSPVHTARLAIWRRLFPRARYIFVHRHPLEVFQSAANMADTYYWYTYLQRPTDEVTNDFITNQYELLYGSYLAERRLIPPDQLVEVAFEDLDADPVGVLQRIYKHFGWDEHLAESEPRFRRYLEGLQDFKKNHFCRLSPEVEAVLRARWRGTFDAFGYS